MTSRWCVSSFFELPLPSVTVVDGEKAVLERRVAVAPAAEVTWYVDTSFTVRGLRAGTDYCFRVVATSRAVRRDAIQRDALLARPTLAGGATIVAHVIERPEHLSPTWTHVARVRPQTDANLAEKTDCQFRVCVKIVQIC